MDKQIYRKDMAECVLCMDPPCSEACSEMDAGRILRSSIADLNGYRAEDISEVLEYVSHEEQEGKLNDN